MNDRNTGGGGLTGATGHLTPDEPDEAFEPGERREVEDAEHHADVTTTQASRPVVRPDADGGARSGSDETSSEPERF